ncbi:MAG: zinc ABC transporter substrate-binding protein [Bacilli bacterium]|nr:zinc ABC transporter substrate-binding protein [Bacilli bacterium]
MKKYKQVLFLLFIMLLVGCTKTNQEKRVNIITTSFPGYDFARAITKNAEDVNVEMLLKPGSEMHDYEPTPKDIIKIEKASMFIYVGGESDEWTDKILKKINPKKTKIIKLIDIVDKKTEEEVEGMEQEHEHHEEYDEHVWTSPVNAIKLTKNIENEIIKIDKVNKENYEKNADEYINKLNQIDTDIRNIVNNSKRKELIFADRFPFRYFTDEYNLKYYAAFKGCSEQTEASSKTIAFLINKIKEDNIPVVLHIELSNKKLANEISKHTNAKVLEFSSAHNISKQDFENQVTYVDIMNKNIEVLKEALN